MPTLRTEAHSRARAALQRFVATARMVAPAFPTPEHTDLPAPESAQLIGAWAGLDLLLACQPTAPALLDHNATMISAVEHAASTLPDLFAEPLLDAAANLAERITDLAALSMLTTRP